MTLAEHECWAALARSRHGVLGTIHRQRGVDAVPVVFAVSADQIVVPIDTVKAKGQTRLGRLTNIEADARCVLLVDNYDDDWSQLWWVRAHATAAEATATDSVLALFAARFPQYRRPGTIIGTVVLSPTKITGWAAG